MNCLKVIDICFSLPLLVSKLRLQSGEQASDLPAEDREGSNAPEQAPEYVRT